MMPKISDTERAALNAGTVGFDRNIFSGNPSLADLEKYKIPQFSPDEKSFMEKEVKELWYLISNNNNFFLYSFYINPYFIFLQLFLILIYIVKSSTIIRSPKIEISLKNSGIVAKSKDSSV